MTCDGTQKLQFQTGPPAFSTRTVPKQRGKGAIHHKIQKCQPSRIVRTLHVLPAKRPQDGFRPAFRHLCLKGRHELSDVVQRDQQAKLATIETAIPASRQKDGDGGDIQHMRYEGMHERVVRRPLIGNRTSLSPEKFQSIRMHDRCHFLLNLPVREVSEVPDGVYTVIWGCLPPRMRSTFKIRKHNVYMISILFAHFTLY